MIKASSFSFTRRACAGQRTPIIRILQHSPVCRLSEASAMPVTLLHTSTQSVFSHTGHISHTNFTLFMPCDQKKRLNLFNEKGKPVNDLNCEAKEDFIWRSSRCQWSLLWTFYFYVYFASYGSFDSLDDNNRLDPRSRSHVLCLILIFVKFKGLKFKRETVKLSWPRRDLYKSRQRSRSRLDLDQHYDGNISWLPLRSMLFLRNWEE